MLLPALLLTFLLGLAQSEAATGALASQTAEDRKGNEPPVCEVLKHPREYAGRKFTFRGAVTSYEHGMVFEPSPACAEREGILVCDFPTDLYRSVGGTKGVGVFATVRGKIAIRDTPRHRRLRGGLPTEAVFCIDRVSDLKPVSNKRT